jgi:hypothetical protein
VSNRKDWSELRFHFDFLSASSVSGDDKELMLSKTQSEMPAVGRDDGHQVQC